MALRETSVRPLSPSLIRWEIFAVFAVSLGASALNALLSLIGSLLAPRRYRVSKPCWSARRPRITGSTSSLQLASIAENLAPGRPRAVPARQVG